MAPARALAARSARTGRMPTVNTFLGTGIDLVILVRALRAGATRTGGVPAINAFPRYLDHMGFGGAFGARPACAYRLPAIFALGHSHSLVWRY